MNYITDENEIKIDQGKVAIYFYSTWMPFHKKFVLMIDKVKEKYKIPFIAIDTDQFHNQCIRFRVSSIPTVIVFKDGMEIKRMTGITLTSAFKHFFSDIS